MKLRLDLLEELTAEETSLLLVGGKSLNNARESSRPMVANVLPL